MLTIQCHPAPVLTTERSVLRPLRPSDAEEVFAMRSDPQVMQHVNRPLAKSLDDARALIELIDSMGAANASVQWAMTLKGEDRFIGLIGFWRIVKEHHLAELGYMLAREHWGRGLITEAITAAVAHGFGTLGLHRVEAITRPGNAASARVLLKNGFVQEGHFKENILWNGAFHDSLHFACLRPGADTP
ncbi:MAG: GNAT family N-acetyltransferase [Flavobacteriales bacterium]